MAIWAEWKGREPWGFLAFYLLFLCEEQMLFNNFHFLSCFPFEIGSYYVAQVGLELVGSGYPLPSYLGWPPCAIAPDFLFFFFLTNGQCLARHELVQFKGPFYCLYISDEEIEVQEMFLAHVHRAR
jgi:hypothetical protein